MPGNRTVRFIISADASQYKSVLSAVEQSGGRLTQTEQKVGSSVRKTTSDLHEHGAAGREAFLVVGQAMDATGAKVGPLATAFYRLDMIFDAMQSKSSRVSKAMTAVGFAGMAAGGLIVAASSKEEAATKDLQSAVEDAGKTWADYRDALDQAAGAQARFGTSKTTAETALATLTRASKDPTKAIKDLALAQDVAASSHVPLQTAAEEIASTYSGSTRILRQYGIAAKDLVDPQKELTKAQHDSAAAAQAMSTAQQHLSDVHERVAAAEEQSKEHYKAQLQTAMDAEQTANQRVADSTTRLADARRNLRDVETQVHEATQLSIDDSFELMHAHDSLADVERRIATGELSGQAAFEAKRDAQERLTQVEADQREKQKMTLSQQHQLRDAHEAVTKAMTAQTRAHEDQAKAHAKTEKVRAAGPAPISVGLRQEEAAAERAFSKAKARVAQANAEMAKAKRDADAFPSRVQQILDQVDERVHGSAERQAKTARGWLKARLAEVENFLGGLGVGTGAAITAVSTGITAVSALADSGVGRMVGRAVRRLFGLKVAQGALNAETVAASAATDATVVASSEAAGVASSAALGPIALAIGALIIIGYELYKHWDKVWSLIKKGADYAWWGIKKGAEVAVNAMISYFNLLVTAVLSPINVIIDAVNFIIGAIDKIHVKAPSWLGGWEIGFNIPKIPQLHFSLGHVSFAGDAPGSGGGVKGEGPAIHGAASSQAVGSTSGTRGVRAYATGTASVPGLPGQPVLAVVHGGEKITPAWDSAGATRGGDGVNIEHLSVVVQAPTLDRRTAYEVGKLVADGVHDQLLIKKRSGNPKLGLD